MMDIEPKKVSLQGLCLKSLKRTYDIYHSNDGRPLETDGESQKLSILSKVLDEYNHVKDMPQPSVSNIKNLPQNDTTEVNMVESEEKSKISEGDEIVTGTPLYPSGPGVGLSQETVEEDTSSFQNLIHSLESKSKSKNKYELVPLKKETSMVLSKPKGSSFGEEGGGGGVLMKFRKRPKPVWHPPWKLMRVMSGHLGWVRSISVEPGNEWFVTGSGDRTIKLWDLASGTLKITLTGHIASVRGLCVSPRHNYLFSCGEDKMVKCWDLVRNKVIRHYHGHLSAVYCLSLHPTLDVLITGGRDSTARVWDIRTKSQIHLLTGHTGAIASLVTQTPDPQVITGSHDCTIRLWDLGMGKSQTVLTNHKKSIRTLVVHPDEFSFASGGADNIKKMEVTRRLIYAKSFRS
jgi:pleiotropic regulator 1